MSIAEQNSPELYTTNNILTYHDVAKDLAYLSHILKERAAVIAC